MWFEWLLWELGVLPALSPPLVLRGARKVEKPILTEALPWPGTGGAQWGQGGEREGMGAQPLLPLVPSRCLPVLRLLPGRHHTPCTRVGFRLPLNQGKMI